MVMTGVDQIQVNNSAEEVDDREIKYKNVKSYLLSTSTESGTNLYDHLAYTITKLIDEKPENAIDILHDISNEIKRSRFFSKTDTIYDKSKKSTEVSLATIQKSLFKEDELFTENEDDLESPLPNLLEIAFFFEQGGIGLNREETYGIWLSLKLLVNEYPVQSVRFWGKLFGIKQNYYIAEVEFTEDAEIHPTDRLTAESEDVEREEYEERLSGDEDEDDYPQPEYKPPPLVPQEWERTGANKKNFFVSNYPGKPWIRLPPVKPQHIVVARQIRKFFTGDLEAPVVTYPPFPGNEAEFLRAQIARISATTHVSPSKFYEFDDEMEDKEGRDTYIENEDFEGIPVRELIDPGFESWVHHVQYILPQGRCTWINPAQSNEEDDEDAEDEEREEADEPEAEVGPPLLQPLSEDAEIDNVPAWSAHSSSSLIPQCAIAAIHSNLWPGAHAFAVGKKFENVYIGWGQKYLTSNYSPPSPPQVQEEYPSDHGIMEAEDPSKEREEEERRRLAEQEEQRGEEGEEEEEEDDY